MGNSAMSTLDQQHLRALEHANRVRLARAAMKREVAAGELAAAEVILDLPLAGEQHGHQRPADEPEALGQGTLPALAAVDRRTREQEDRHADRTSASRPRGGADGEGDGPRAAPTRSDANRAGGSRSRMLRSPDATARGDPPPGAGRPRGGTSDRWPARRCGRRDRAGRPTSRSVRSSTSVHATPCVPGSPASARSSSSESTASAKWWVEPMPTLPGSSSGYSRHVTERAGPPVGVAENEVARASGSSSFTPCSTSRMPEQVAVERERALSVLDDQRDVVDPGDPKAFRLFHRRDSRSPGRGSSAEGQAAGALLEHARGGRRRCPRTPRPRRAGGSRARTGRCSARAR